MPSSAPAARGPEQLAMSDPRHRRSSLASGGHPRALVFDVEVPRPPGDPGAGLGSPERQSVYRVSLLQHIGCNAGTQTGPLVTEGGTIPASGNAFAFPYVDLFQLRDGVCVSHRVFWDNRA